MFGVWWRGGPDGAALKQQYPWIKGVFAAFRWSELEPENNRFDWAPFDRTLTRRAEAGFHIQFMVWVGPDSRRCIYLHPAYQRFYHRMIRQVAAHIDTLPPQVRARVVCIQTVERTTGDEGGHKGSPLEARYALPEEQWRAFKFEIWKLFDRLYRDKRPKIHLLISSGNPGHGCQLNDEKLMMSFLDPLINHPESGRGIRARSEMDEMFKGWFQEVPVWNMYWLNLWGSLFYARCGGHKDAAASPGALCALRDRLDAADFQRFPAEKFGADNWRGSADEQKQGLQRTLNIARAFARYGALQGDPDKAMKQIMQNRDAQRMNDVGWNIEAGNYQRYLSQHDPSGASQGYWRQGPNDQPYGRFARGFDASAGKNAMYFAFAERFFSGKPLSARYPVKVRVIYLDSGRGSWALKYDAVDQPQKTALTVRNTATGRWKEAAVTLPDAHFGHRRPPVPHSRLMRMCLYSIHVPGWCA